LTIIDANVLIYAYGADARQHPAAFQWLASDETIGLPWPESKSLSPPAPNR